MLWFSQRCLHNFFYLQKLNLKEFSIGDIPIEILDVESKIENNDAIIDIVASYHGNALLKTEVDLVTGLITKTPANITDIEVREAKMRIILEGFDSEYPFISKVKFAFIEDPFPNCSWDVHNLAGIADLPGFDELAMSYLDKKIKKKIILPAMFSFPIKTFFSGECTEESPEECLEKSP